MLKTICVLEPGTRSNGGKCLRGRLNREIVTRDRHGTERVFPTDTPIILVKNPKGNSYSLLAQLADPADDFRGELAECQSQQFPDSPF
jgi:hypothetical protein